MRYPQGAAKPQTVNDIDMAAPRQGDGGAFEACAEADRLFRGYFTRGSHEGPADQEAHRGETLSRLFDEVEAAVVRVATFRALTLNEITRKRALQDLMRAHRNVLSNHLALVGQSIDRDLRRFLASAGQSQGASQGGWLGWARQTWKGPRPAEAVAPEPERLSV